MDIEDWRKMIQDKDSWKAVTVAGHRLLKSHKAKKKNITYFNYSDMPYE